MHRKMVVLSLIVIIVACCSLSFTEKPKFKNLKVLDKNISEDELELVMKGFKTALGVKCSFCHAKSKTDPKKLDFASDENEHKDIARGMIRMARRINKKYFGNEKEDRITCFTCHHGNEEPEQPPKEVLGH